MATSLSAKGRILVQIRGGFLPRGLSFLIEF